LIGLRILRQFLKEYAQATRIATVRKIHGDTITVQVGDSPKYLRGIPVIGGTDYLIAGDKVTLDWIEGRCYARAAKSSLS